MFAPAPPMPPHLIAELRRLSNADGVEEIQRASVRRQTDASSAFGDAPEAAECLDVISCAFSEGVDAVRAVADAAVSELQSLSMVERSVSEHFVLERRQLKTTIDEIDTWIAGAARTIGAAPAWDEFRSLATIVRGTDLIRSLCDAITTTPESLAAMRSATRVLHPLGRTPSTGIVVDDDEKGSADDLRLQLRGCSPSLVDAIVALNNSLQGIPAALDTLQRHHLSSRDAQVRDMTSSICKQCTELVSSWLAQAVINAPAGERQNAVSVVNRAITQVEEAATAVVVRLGCDTAELFAATTALHNAYHKFSIAVSMSLLNTASSPNGPRNTMPQAQSTTAAVVGSVGSTAQAAAPAAPSDYKALPRARDAAHAIRVAARRDRSSILEDFDSDALLGLSAPTSRASSPTAGANQPNAMVEEVQRRPAQPPPMPPPPAPSMVTSSAAPAQRPLPPAAVMVQPVRQVALPPHVASQPTAARASTRENSPPTPPTTASRPSAAQDDEDMPRRGSNTSVASSFGDDDDEATTSRNLFNLFGLFN